jgi:hypothetical protein
LGRFGVARAGPADALAVLVVPSSGGAAGATRGADAAASDRADANESRLAEGTGGTIPASLTIGAGTRWFLRGTDSGASGLSRSHHDAPITPTESATHATWIPRRDAVLLEPGRRSRTVSPDPPLRRAAATNRARQRAHCARCLPTAAISGRPHVPLATRSINPSSKHRVCML